MKLFYVYVLHNSKGNFIYIGYSENLRKDIQISVPFRRPYVKEVYVKRVLELIGGDNNEEKS